MGNRFRTPQSVNSKKGAVAGAISFYYSTMGYVVKMTIVYYPLAGPVSPKFPPPRTPALGGSSLGLPPANDISLICGELHFKPAKTK